MCVDIGTVEWHWIEQQKTEGEKQLWNTCLIDIAHDRHGIKVHDDNIVGNHIVSDNTGRMHALSKSQC